MMREKGTEVNQGNGEIVEMAGKVSSKPGPV